jgi:hypothetical protein
MDKRINIKSEQHVTHEERGDSFHLVYDATWVGDWIRTFGRKMDVLHGLVEFDYHLPRVMCEN